MPRSKYSKKQVAAGLGALRESMTLYALFHEPQIDARTLTILRKHDLVVDLDLPPVDNVVLEVLADNEHPSRVRTSLGPIVFRDTSTDKPSREALDVAHLLYNSNLEVRRSGLAHFQHILNVQPLLLASRSRSSIVEFGQSLLTDDPDVWRDAAVKIGDALDDDFLLRLAGLKQCRELSWSEGVEERLRPLLRASVSSLDDVAATVVTSVTGNTDEILRLIGECEASASALGDACDRYYHAVGHMPLSGRLSLGQLVTEWIDIFGEQAGCWDEIWAWVDSVPSPLAQYHACIVFIQNPELIPDGKHVELWERIHSVVGATGAEDQDNEWTKPWLMRYVLAAYYTHYLECLYSGSDGERIAAFAWWLADTISSVFGESSDAIDYLMNTTIVPTANNFALVWQLGHPTIASASLRNATLLTKSLWELCLECELGSSIASLHPELLGSDMRQHIGASIEQNLLSCFPLKAGENEQILYSFDRTIAPTAKAWAELGEDAGSSHPLATMLEHYQRATDPDELASALRTVLNEHEGGRYLLVRNIRTIAYTGDGPTDRIWDCIQDESWRGDTWPKLDLGVLEILFTAMTEIQAQGDEKWTVHLPHFLAMTCEALSEDRERQELFFAFTVVNSVQTGTVSALERLLRGPHQDEFVRYVENWRTNLLDLMPIAPGWIAGKMRAVLASLYVAE